MYNLISSFFQGYYPLNTQSHEPDYLAITDAQLTSTQNNNVNDNENNKSTYESINVNDDNNNKSQLSESNYFKDSYFNHLNFLRQSYFFHFKQSMKYSFLTWKASIYFFIHAIYPDIFHHTGSDIVVGINDEIIQTYKDCLDRIDREIFDV